MPGSDATPDSPKGADAPLDIRNRRVAFYLDQPFHAAILRPVHEILDGEVDTLITADREEVVRFVPHVVAQASFADLRFFRRHLPRTIIGSLEHGLTPKGIPARIARQADPLARTFDFICVGDDSLAASYRAAGVLPHEFWYTGYPQLDPLFRRDPPPPLPLDPEQPTVLFAPTWNPGLTAATVLGPDLATLMRGQGPPLNIIIKPHPHLPLRRRRWMQWWQTLAERDRRVLLVADADADITQYMLAADLLVSDVSSVIFLFLALDRPIVLVTNPDHRSDPAYDPSDINWRWRDVGIEVTAPHDLAPAIAHALAHPEEGADARRRYAERLFGARRDGRNAERVAQHIIETLRRHASLDPYAVLPIESRGGLRARWGNRGFRLVRSPLYLRYFKGATEDIRLRLRMLRSRVGRR